MPAKASTARDYRERINRVIFHVEQHLGEALSVEGLAKVACFSPFHFHRVFRAFTGEPIADFVRRLRLERAAHHLLYVDAPITELGLNAGYETPAAFSRAFSRHFGTSPSDYRRGGQSTPCVGVRPLALDMAVEQENAMTITKTIEGQIKQIDPMPVLFVRRTGAYHQAAEQAFGALCGFAGPRGLLGPGCKMLGISHDDPKVTDDAQLRYDACLALGERSVDPEGEISAKTIAGGSYGVFVHEGPYEGFSQTYDAIFKGWLPQSGRQLRDEPCFEVYLNSPQDAAPADLRTEIWVPLT
jgi:AraC family transcriptional regulator